MGYTYGTFNYENLSKFLGTRGMVGAPYGIRTRVAAVRGRCPRPLDEGDVYSSCERYSIFAINASFKRDDSLISNPWPLPPSQRKDC